VVAGELGAAVTMRGRCEVLQMVAAQAPMLLELVNAAYVSGYAKAAKKAGAQCTFRTLRHVLIAARHTDADVAGRIDACQYATLLRKK